LSSVDQSCTKSVSGWTVKNLAEHTSVVNWSEQKKSVRPSERHRFFPKCPKTRQSK
jgi:hypothetical protein